MTKRRKDSKAWRRKTPPRSLHSSQINRGEALWTSGSREDTRSTWKIIYQKEEICNE